MGVYPDKAASPAYYYVDDDGSPITARPRWFGRGLGRMGLRVRMAVSTVLLTHLLNGRDAAGRRIARSTQTTGGHDWVHAPVKSVSIVHGLSRPETRAFMEWVLLQATKQALEFAQDEILRTRKTIDRIELHVPVEGLISAFFLHRVNRAGHPHLHIHAVTSSSVYWQDGRGGGEWMTLHSGGLRFVFKSAGAVFDCVLRYHLSQLFGARWVRSIADNKSITYELAGFNRGLINAFSTRRRAILAASVQFKHATWKIGRIAAQRTRKTKKQAQSSADRAEWVRIAARHGLTPGAIPDVFSRRIINRHRMIGIFRELVGPEGLTEHVSIFRRHDVFRAIADRIPSGASYKDLRILVHNFLSIKEVVSLGRDDHGEPIYAIRSLLDTEKAALQDVEEMKDIDRSLNKLVLAGVLDFARLSDDHQAAIEHAVCCRGGVIAIVGYAGTGKTSDCQIIAQAYRFAGRRVIGAAPTADAARELGQKAQVRTFTLTKLLFLLREEDRLKKDRSASRRGYPLGPLAKTDLIILDECSMAGTREFAELLYHVRKAGCRLLLVGDPAQLPPVPAGGLLSSVLHIVGAHVLTDNRRQSDPVDVETVDALRCGMSDRALQLMELHGRIHFYETIAERREAQVAAFMEARNQSEGEPVVLIGGTHEEIDELNRLTRQVRLALGELGTESLEVRERDFRVGDEVVFLKNPTGEWRMCKNDLHGVSNGTRGVVAGLVADPATGKPTISVRLQGGSHRTMPLRYLAAGLVDYGYAVTGYKVQSRDFGWSGLAGTWALSQELAYVAFSRGRNRNDLFVSREDLTEDKVLDDQALRRRLVWLLGRSRQKMLASSFLAKLGRSDAPPIEPTGLVPECPRCIERNDSPALSLIPDPPVRVNRRPNPPMFPGRGITGAPGLPRHGMGPR